MIPRVRDRARSDEPRDVRVERMARAVYRSSAAPADSRMGSAASPSSPVDEAMRNDAGAALWTIAQLDEAERLEVLASLLGVDGSAAAYFSSVIRTMPEEGIGLFIDGLLTTSPQAVAALARHHTAKGT
jgi:hypothetical protein